MIYSPLRAQETLVGATSIAAKHGDLINSQVAVLDDQFEIVVVNSVWRDYAIRNGLDDPSFGVGANYLEICRQAAEAGLDSAKRVIHALQEMMDGCEHSITLDYDDQRQFPESPDRLMLHSWEEKGRPRVVLVHSRSG